jgi:uncharacterized YigZ family protein
MAGELAEKYIFKAPAKDADIEMTVRRSRFIGSVRTVLSADEAADMLKEFPDIYPKANHHCWAYRIGIGDTIEHCSDAGEPSGSAGRPILGALKRNLLENSMIVVTRYFGGIKLGVRGLIEAYGEAAELAVKAAGVVEKEMREPVLMVCGYDYAKTLSTTLHKMGYSENDQHVAYGEFVTTKIEVPLYAKSEIESALDEMEARGFLSKLEWSGKSIPRARK